MDEPEHEARAAADVLELVPARGRGEDGAGRNLAVFRSHLDEAHPPDEVAAGHTACGGIVGEAQVRVDADEAPAHLPEAELPVREGLDVPHGGATQERGVGALGLRVGAVHAEELAEALEPRGRVVGMIHAHDTKVAPLLFLFDIDGTILSTRGAGREALDEAFLRVCGWPDATRGVPIGGSTDGAIVRGVAARFGHDWTDGPAPYDEAAFEDAYLTALRRRLAVPGRVELCPGVVEILDALAGRAHLALLTGNWVAGARVKLGAVGLADRFGVGAYGGDAVDRNALVPVAQRRADAAGLCYARTVVIGDTPADVACARAGGALAVAVETGHGDVADLVAAGPDLQVPDLARGHAAVLGLLG